MSDPSSEEFEKSRQAIADALVLKDNAGSDEATANRLYYACYHAAKAVLYARNIQPRTHAGVVAQFGEHVVKNGDATEGDRLFLARSQTRREQADYEYEPVRENVDDLFAQTKSFVEKLKELV